jgi:hypothetical protein
MTGRITGGSDQSCFSGRIFGTVLSLGMSRVKSKELRMIATAFLLTLNS